MKKEAEEGIKNLIQIYLTAYYEALRMTKDPSVACDASSAVLMILRSQSTANVKSEKKAYTPEDIKQTFHQAFIAGMYAGQAAEKNEGKGKKDEEP